MTVPELAQRLKDWLASEYAAVIFEDGGVVVAYALYSEQPRKKSICGNCLWCATGVGRTSGVRPWKFCATQIWPKNKRLTVGVLVQNTAAVAFWRAVGYQDYSLTLEILPAGIASDDSP